MVPLPKPTPSTLRAIYAAYEAAHEHYDSLGISVGEAGTECDRALFYTFRWASPAEEMTGQKLRLFRTGDIEETRLTEDLERIGVEVYGSQDRIRLASGHIRGKCDGKAMGIIEAPKTEHLLEFKSSNLAGFKEIQKHGCRKAKPLHYAQCQLGMHAFCLTRCLYLVVCKDSDELYSERIEYDVEYCLRLIARCERIIAANDPPSRISENPEFFGCRFCRHREICHADAWPRATCRSCLYSTPEMGGDGHWSCGRFSKPISSDEQKAGCMAHLHLPGLVPGVQVDSSEENETVTYKMKTGEFWTDGLHA